VARRAHSQVASTDAAPGNSAEFETHKQQAKAILKKLNSRSPARMSVEAGSLAFKCVHSRDDV